MKDYKSILESGGCTLVEERGKDVCYIDDEGYYKVQKKENLFKHRSSIIDKKLSDDHLKHNLKLICKVVNLNFIRYEVTSESKPREIWIYYSCNICGYEHSADYNSIQQKHGCPICANNIRLNLNKITSRFNSRNYTLLSTEYTNAHEKLEYICNTHNDYKQYITWNDFQQGKGCKYCDLDRKRGSTNPNWKGGITPLYNYLRNELKEWKLESMKNCGYKCVITGVKTKDLEIHHLKSFNIILNETVNELNIPIYTSIGKYTGEQLVALKKLFIKKHFELLGVCLTKDVHNLFHSTYGKGNNTPEQFKEFKAEYDKLIHRNEMLI